MKRKRKGFTLIEILVVAIILAMLSVLVVPGVMKRFGQAKHEIAKAKMGIIEKQLAAFQLDCGRCPTDSEGLAALIEPPSGLEEKWAGRYLKESEILDP